MAKKQKVKDKSKLEEVSVKSEDALNDELIEEDEQEASLEEVDEVQTAENRIQELEEALLRSRAELDNAFKRNTADIVAPMIRDVGLALSMGQTPTEILG